MGASHMSVAERPGELLSTTISPTGVTVTSVNHASLLVERDGLRLLTDPWFSSTAFGGAWGLRVENPDAEELAETATHLWISHRHADHLHPATLSALAARAPNIRALANESYNFSMAPRLHALGFRRVIVIPERRWVRLDDDVELFRIPSGGIDNALVIRTPDYTVLNYNDCSLPGSALRTVLREVGRIDCLCTNYDLTSKLFEPFDPHAVKDRTREVLRRTIDVVDPSAVIPFASSHYFRAAPTACQNLAFLTHDELAEISDADPRVVTLRVGDSVRLSRREQALVTPRVPRILELPRTIAIDRPSVEPARVLAVASRFVKRLRRDFLGIRVVPQPLHVGIRDAGVTVALDWSGPHFAVAAPHIAAHSADIVAWLESPFGGDLFHVGGSFEVRRPCTRVLERWLLVQLLCDNALAPRHTAKAALRPAGRRFLWNRREEAVATIREARLRPGALHI
jgi:L-ascorbate metabolism protein UlaG (beta-lactamase superfamily)